MAKYDIEVSPDGEALIKLLMQIGGCTTSEELFWDAMKMYAWGMEEVRQGRPIASINELEKKYRIYEMSGLVVQPTPPSTAT